MPIELTERQRRLIDAVLILAVVALGFVVLGDVADVFYAFGDILLLFFLAWLLSFALLPLINFVTRVVPRLPQAGAVIIVYLAIVVLLLAIVIQASASLATSIGQFIEDAPAVRGPARRTCSRRSSRASPRSASAGRPREPGADDRREPPARGPSQLVGPLQSLAVASIGVFGNVLIARDPVDLHRRRPRGDHHLPVPARAAGFVAEARLLQTSVARSFGGFLRGQAIMGLVYRRVHGGREHRVRARVRRRSRPSRRACCMRSRSSGRSCRGCRRSSWRSCSTRRPRCPCDHDGRSAGS